MRVLPQRRWARWLSIVMLLLAYSAVMWFFAFPWIDRTYISRPGLEEGTLISPTPTNSIQAPVVVPSASVSPT